ncbi:MAG: hypothetical protein EOO00_12480 [Chitinophagaceae bacterium]|nr:MAG: hypothetical protein EOO00_12480 [Chitinophagaceae bacterium]
MNPLSLVNTKFLKPGHGTRTSCLFALLMLVACFSVKAQSKKDKRLQLADQYFAAGDYFTAADLYEQFLHPKQAAKEPTGFR